MKDRNVSVCDGVFLDPGGFERIPDNISAITTLYPQTANKRIQLVFTEFNIQYEVDHLKIYDGPDTKSPVLFNSAMPTPMDTITATNPSGCLTIKFIAETHNYNFSGWIGITKCINYPPQAPSEFRASLTAEKYVRLQWKDNSANEDGFIVQSSFANPVPYFYEIARVPANTTEFIDPNGYYPGLKNLYRVIAANKDGGKSTPAETFISPPLTMFTGQFYACEYQLLDPGGTGNYDDNSTTQMTLYPHGRAKISLSFTSFDTEKEQDILFVYDGEDRDAPLLGKFSGDLLPPRLKATNAIGALTIVFVTNRSITKPGWEAQVSCSITPLLVNAFEMDESRSNSIEIEQSDQIEIYPNPASTSVKIRLPVTAQWLAIDLVDMKGNRKKLLTDNQNEIELDATTVEPGIYMIQCRSKSGNINKRLVIK